MARKKKNDGAYALAMSLGILGVTTAALMQMRRTGQRAQNTLTIGGAVVGGGTLAILAAQETKDPMMIAAKAITGGLIGSLLPSAIPAGPKEPFVKTAGAITADNWIDRARQQFGINGNGA